MITLNMRPNISALHRAISDFGAKQVPFATAVALNALADGVSKAESAEIDKVFDKPTPFTERGFFVTRATKSRQIAFVAAKDIQARYLAPYVFGGERFLGSKKAMLVPREIAVNQYGNLPRNKLKQLQGKANIFIGPVKSRDGKVVSGVWQRTGVTAHAKGMKRRGVAQPVGGLKLLIRFKDTTPVRKRFPFGETAREYVKRNAKAEFTTALRMAVRTARKR